MMKWVMILMEMTEIGNVLAEDKHRFLRSYDPDAHGGRGYIETTYTLKLAMRFDSPMEPFELWKKQSTVLPLRPDGKPNRPLTAFSMTTMAVEE
jgi:hypothetical protein